MTYTIKYKYKGEWFWKTIKNVEDHGTTPTNTLSIQKTDGAMEITKEGILLDFCEVFKAKSIQWEKEHKERELKKAAEIARANSNS